MKRRTVLEALALASSAIALPAKSQSTRIVFGYAAVNDFASVFVAAEEGYFKKRNLDVELKFIPISSTIPAALQSDSLQIGGPTPTAFLQAVDGGLDLVVVAGSAVTSKATTKFGLIARAGSGIKTPQDCTGRKIGVPGLGAFLHVTFRAWLKQNGVDYGRVNFIETAFLQHADLLRGGSIDAVVTVDPFMSRIIDSGVGYAASSYSTFLDEGNQTMVHVAKREWTQKNAAAARAFRDAVVEGAAFMQQPNNDDKVRTAIAKYIKLPPEVLATLAIAPPGPIVTDKQLNYWLSMMRDQQMLKGDPNVAQLIFR